MAKARINAANEGAVLEGTISSSKYGGVMAEFVLLPSMDLEVKFQAIVTADNGMELIMELATPVRMKVWDAHDWPNFVEESLNRMFEHAAYGPDGPEITF